MRAIACLKRVRDLTDEAKPFTFPCWENNVGKSKPLEQRPAYVRNSKYDHTPKAYQISCPHFFKI